MDEEEAVSKWSIKDALIVIPFLASALALTWEVGYFARIRGGAFGLFSVAEHLTFALQALPIALAVTTAAMMGLVRDTVLVSVTFRLRRWPSLKARLLEKRGWTLVVSVCGAFLAIASYFPIVDFGLFVLFASSMVPYFLISYAPRQFLMDPLVIYGGIVCVFLVTLLVGFDSARNEIKSSRPLSAITIGEKGKDIESEVKVRVLRTGERGILYFNPATQNFALLPWDNVKRLDWAISPLLSR